MSIGTETYALGIERSPLMPYFIGVKLYQLNPMKFSRLKPKMNCADFLYQLRYRLFGTTSVRL